MPAENNKHWKTSFIFSSVPFGHKRLRLQNNSFNLTLQTVSLQDNIRSKFLYTSIFPKSDHLQNRISSFKALIIYNNENTFTAITLQSTTSLSWIHDYNKLMIRFYCNEHYARGKFVLLLLWLILWTESWRLVIQITSSPFFPLWWGRFIQRRIWLTLLFLLVWPLLHICW